ncbi:Hsp20/alpha crystallin family protein [Haloarcula sp. GH36]|uniref:Hsp20/alpha crystallin family protein n=1 Tax=Haloarcula montana TaxID=3111776 RepID=UPI002D77020A|nr:Hsp20/alpha crystallin family protein [Haloarcula sp. GH36]
MEPRYNSFENMDRFFDQMRQSMFGGDRGVGRGFDDSVRVERTDEAIVVVADMPGFEPDEIGVRLHDDRLHITADHDAGDEGSVRRRSLRETIALGEAVDPETVTAGYRNGVLEVRLPLEPDSHEGIDIEIGE